MAEDKAALLEQWAKAGSDEVMLPSGFRVRLELPSVVEIVMRDILPAHLRVLATRFASGEGVEMSALSEAEKQHTIEMVRLLICASVKAAALPGSDEFQPLRLSPEDVDERLPAVDREQLEFLVLHFRTPRQVDALSRLAHGLIDAAEADAVIAAEAAESIEGWQPFRDASDRFAQLGRGGPRVRTAPVGPADHLGPGGRLRARRGAGAGAAQRGRRRAASPKSG